MGATEKSVKDTVSNDSVFTNRAKVAAMADCLINKNNETSGDQSSVTLSGLESDHGGEVNDAATTVGGSEQGPRGAESQSKHREHDSTLDAAVNIKTNKSNAPVPASGDTTSSDNIAGTRTKLDNGSVQHDAPVDSSILDSSINLTLGGDCTNLTVIPNNRGMNETPATMKKPKQQKRRRDKVSPDLIHNKGPHKTCRREDSDDDNEEDDETADDESDMESHDPKLNLDSKLSIEDEATASSCSSITCGHLFPPELDPPLFTSTQQSHVRSGSMGNLTFEPILAPDELHNSLPKTHSLTDLSKDTKIPTVRLCEDDLEVIKHSISDQITKGITTKVAELMGPSLDDMFKGLTKMHSETLNSMMQSVQQTNEKMMNLERNIEDKIESKIQAVVVNLQSLQQDEK